MPKKNEPIKITSTDELNKFIKVSNPAVWVMLILLLLCLAAMCIWAVFGRIYTTVKVAAVVDGGEAVCYVKESDINDIKENMPIEIDGNTFKIDEVNMTPTKAEDENIDGYALYVGMIKDGEWVYEVTVQTGLADGIYDAQIITEEFTPISFILN